MKNEENSLVHVNKKSFIYRVMRLFRNLFRKNILQTEVKNTNFKEDDRKIQFMKNIKNIENEDVQLLNLQQQYQRGEITEENMTKEQVNKLCDLYDKQIDELRKRNELRRQEILQYKTKYQMDG